MADIPSKLGSDLSAEYDLAKSRRLGYEKLWLQDLRQYKGIYDPEIQARLKLYPNRSKAFIRETRTKIRTLDARLLDLLFPANGEKNWGINPTPDPEFTPQEEQSVRDQISRLIAAECAQNNQPPRDPTQQELEIALRNVAKTTADNMSREIDDQLTTIKYRTIIRNILHSGHLYGTGFMKGPLVNEIIKQKWQRQQTPGTDPQTGGKIITLSWVLKNTPVLKPYAEFKPIWNLYPDLSVTEFEDMRYMFERHPMPKHKVIDLTKRSDFNGALILDYLTDHPSGDMQPSQFETDLYTLKEFNMSPYPSVGMYELVEYWGIVTMDQLLDLGVDNLELQQVVCNVWMLGKNIVKIAPQPIQGVSLPYYVYYFDKDESSLYGEGVAAIMRDPQKLTNASVRAMIDNASHCAGPQYEVNVDLLQDGEDPQDIGAFKVWLRTGKDADVAGKEVVRIKQISSYTPEFMQMWQAFSRSGDEVTIIPRYLQGDSRVSGAGRTMGGLSMLMGQANVGLSDLVKMFDDGITKPFIDAMYHWNMQFNPDDSIKGDLDTVARGSTALMAKEVRAQMIHNFLQMTLNSQDAPWVKRGELLAEWADTTDIGRDVAVRDQTEYEDYMAQQSAGADQARKLGMFEQLQMMQAEIEAKMHADIEVALAKNSGQGPEGGQSGEIMQILTMLQSRMGRIETFIQNAINNSGGGMTSEQQPS